MGEKTYTIRYNMEGMHEQVMATKSLLYAVNAVRLTIKDITLIMQKPTISNIMWTAIQITRTYTHIRRLIRLATAEQQALAAQAITTRAIIEGTQVTGYARAGMIQTTLAPLAAQRGLLTTAIGAMGGPYVAGALIGATVVTGAAYAIWYQQEQQRKAWIERQREVARSQGLEPP